MDQYSRGLPLSSIVPGFPHANIDAFWGPYDSAESAMVYPVPSGQGLAQGVIPVSARVPGLEFGVKVMNGSQLVRIEKYQIMGVQTYRKLILTEDDVDLPQDLAQIYECDNEHQGYDALHAAVQAGKVIVWGKNVVNVIRTNETINGAQSSVYRLSCITYNGNEAWLHIFKVPSTSPNDCTVSHVQLSREDAFLNYNSGTTYQELQSLGQKPVKVEGYIARIVQGDNLYTISYVDGEGVLHIITHTSSNSKTTATKDLSESVHIDADDTNNVFAIKDNKGTTIGSITLGTNATNGAAELTFVAGSNQFTATLPNLTYDSTTQMLKMVDAGGNESNLIKLSNLQIKTVFDYNTYEGNAPTSVDKNAYAVGDLALVEKQDTTTTPATVSYKLAVVQSVTAGSLNDTVQWQEIGSINNVSLQADQVSFTPNGGLSSTNVQGAINQLYGNLFSMEGESDEIDVTDYTPVAGFILYTHNTWTTEGGSSRNSGIFIPINGGDTFEVSARSDANCNIAFLKSNTTPVQDASVNYATGESLIRITMGNSVTHQAPDDANYLWVGIMVTELDVTPEEIIKLNETKGAIPNLIDKNKEANRFVSLLPGLNWYNGSVDAGAGVRGPQKIDSANRVRSDFFANQKDKKLTISVGNTDYKINVIGYDANLNISVIANTVQSYDDYIPSNYDYFVLVVRKTDNGDLTADDVNAYANISITSLPQLSVAQLLEDIEKAGNSNIPLYQYSTDRLISKMYPKSELNTLATLWLSDDSNYECVFYGKETNDPDDTNHNYPLTSWGDDKATSQRAILNCEHNYCWCWVRNANSPSSAITPSEVHLVNSLTADINALKAKFLNKSGKPSSGYEDFTIAVDTSVANTDSSTLALQDSQNYENDNGRIYLPSSYNADGKPTRLIIHCHGASQNYNNSTAFPKSSSLVTVDYLLAKGYAVLDVNGLPGTHSYYATTCGNPIAYRSYLKAYEWAVKNYNLYKEVFVIGISAGSIPALQISQIGTIPVLACATYCGIMDFSRGWMLLGGYHGNNTQGPEIKGYLADKFTFAGTRPTFGNVDPCSDDEWEYVVSNWEKYSGWNPYTMGITSTMTREEYREIVTQVYGSDVPNWINQDYSFESIQKMLLSFKIPQRGSLTAYQTAIAQEQKLFDSCSIHRKVPLKIFHATDDTVAPYRYSRYFYEMCKRGGSTVEFRTFPSGGHNPVGNSQSVTVDGVSISTNVLSIEVLNWLQRFESSYQE